MIINCKHCENKFAIDAEEVGFDGRLVKCSHCEKEWFQESKAQILEKKLIELDRNLQATELHLVEKKTNHNNKIRKLEKALKTKKDELEKQKKLEERIVVFEKRIRETERQIESQNSVENRINKLEKEIKKNSFDSFIKNNHLEKRTQELQNKIHTEDLQNKLGDLEKLQEEVNAKSVELSDNQINIEKKTSELADRVSSIKPKEDFNQYQNDSKKFFFWSSDRKQKKEPDTGELVKQYFKKKNKLNIDAKVSNGDDYRANERDLISETLDKRIQNTKKIDNN